jgi:hypothetical protein
MEAVEVKIFQALPIRPGDILSGRAPRPGARP